MDTSASPALVVALYIGYCIVTGTFEWYVETLPTLGGQAPYHAFHIVMFGRLSGEIVVGLAVSFWVWQRHSSRIRMSTIRSESK